MKSTISSKFGRGVEKAKYSIDVKYIGEFTNRDDITLRFQQGNVFHSSEPSFAF